MRLCRFNDNRLGVLEGDMVRDVTAALDVLPAARYPFPMHDLMFAELARLRAEIGRQAGGALLPVETLRFLSPVANPGKLVAAPVNYQAHVDEAMADEATFTRAHIKTIHEAGLFLKATSSLIGAGEPIRIRHKRRRTDHEIELAVVIGKVCKAVPRAAALRYVAGYAIGLDITVRGPEERSLRKSIDTYSVLGPVLVTADEFGDPAGRTMRLSVDGEPRQHANTAALIMDVPSLIEFASSYYTLMPGDVIFTGTPEGVGPIEPGNVIEAFIEGIGSFRIDVTAA